MSTDSYIIFRIRFKAGLLILFVKGREVRYN